MKKNKIKFFLIVTLISFAIILPKNIALQMIVSMLLMLVKSSDINEQFIIAGHAYGSHQSDNPALSYQFLNF